MEHNTKILFFQRIIPVYRIPVFKKLYDKFGIILFYSAPRKNSSIKTGDISGFQALRLKRFFYWNSDTAMVQNPLPLIRKYKPAIIITEGSPSYFTLWILLFLRIFFRYKLVLWSHGIKFRSIERPFSNIRDKLQLWLFNRADAVINYSSQRAEILKEYINRPSKVFIAENTLDTDILKNLYKKLADQGKEKIREELGFVSKIALVYIGRLIKSKGIKDLIIAFKILKENNCDAALNIIGDGPERDLIESEISSEQKIYLHGSIFDNQEISKILFASDLMVMPGNVGLSLVHSFSFGCPVLTYKPNPTEGPSHGPEFEYLKDGTNGVMCEPNPQGLANEIIRLSKDPYKVSELSAGALKTAYNEACISKFLLGFESTLNYLKFNNN